MLKLLLGGKDRQQKYYDENDSLARKRYTPDESHHGVFRLGALE